MMAFLMVLLISNPLLCANRKSNQHAALCVGRRINFERICRNLIRIEERILLPPEDQQLQCNTFVVLEEFRVLLA